MPGGGAEPGGGSMPGGSSRDIGGPGDTRDGPLPDTSSQSSATMSTVRGGLQLGPPGRWWDDKHFAKTLHLRPEQKKRMDRLFDENRANLVSRYQALQQEESKMESLARGQTLDESALFAQIDRVSQARADLEKANYPPHAPDPQRNGRGSDRAPRSLPLGSRNSTCQTSLGYHSSEPTSFTGCGTFITKEADTVAITHGLSPVQATVTSRCV